MSNFPPTKDILTDRPNNQKTDQPIISQTDTVVHRAGFRIAGMPTFLPFFFTFTRALRNLSGALDNNIFVKKLAPKVYLGANFLLGVDCH